MNKIRVVIADDERPAREFLKHVLATFESVEVVGEAVNGFDALQVIEKTAPDLALLDLQMPELSGIEAVKQIPSDRIPIFAFVTAYDEYAVKAFEMNAVDYLLKPVEKKRLALTLERVEQAMSARRLQKRNKNSLRGVLQALNTVKRNEYLVRIPVKTRGSITLIPVNDVVAIIADGELLHIHKDSGERFLINFRLKDIEQKLDPQDFIRLSRGAIANLKKVSSIDPMPGGTFLLKMQNGQELSTSRIQSKLLRDRFFKL